MKKTLLWAAFSLLQCTVYAQTWTPAGPDDSNQPALQGSASTSMVSDKAGGFYFAYTQRLWASSSTVQNKAAVRHWDGSTWQQTGQLGFSAGSVDYLKIVMSPDTTPYVVYRDNGMGGKASVKYFDGSTWNSLGGAVSPGPVKYPGIAIDAGGTPYVAYADSLRNYKITVKKWNGTSWQVTGDSTFVTGTVYDFKLTANSYGAPQLFVQYYSGGPMLCEVFRLAGTNWTSLGNPAAGILGSPSWTAIANATGDTTYVAYTGSGGGNFVTKVRKYNGASWTDVGGNITPNKITDLQLLTDSVHGAYVSGLSSLNPGFSDVDYLTVRHYNGSAWEVVGPDTFVTDQIARMPVLGLDTGGAPHVLFSDYTFYGNLLLRKLEGSSWRIKGNNAGFNNSSSSMLTVAAAPDGSKAYCISGNYRGPGLHGFSGVYRFDDTAWTFIGQPGTSSTFGNLMSIAVHPDGHPWVAVSDSATNEGTVWRYADTGWVNAGSIGIAAGVALTIDGAGTAYVVCLPPYNNEMTIKKYSGTGWVTLNGSPLPPNSSISYFRLKTDRQGVPHILYGTHGSTATGSQYAFGIFKYDPSATNNWPSVIGTFNSGMGTPAGSTPDFAFDTTNALYITYLNDNRSGIKVKRFNPVTFTFSDIVTPAADSLRGSYPRIQFGADGNLFLSYYNWSPSTVVGGTSVQRLAGSSWQPVGNAPFSATASYYQELALLNNRMIATFCYGASFAYKFDCGQPVTVSQAAADTVVCNGAGAGFSTAASNAIAYRWQFYTAQGWANVPENAQYSGTASAALSLSSTTIAQSGTRFRCIYTNPCSGTLTGQAATLYIDTAGLPAPALSIAANPAVACAGAPVRFTATTVNGGHLRTFEWRVNGAVVAGVTDSSFTSTALVNGDVVTCKLSRASACSPAIDVASSNTIHAAIAPAAAPGVSITAVPGTVITAGQATTFTAAPVNGGPAPHYQWLVNNNPVAGVTAATYTTTALVNGDVVAVKIIRDDTCAASNTALSDPLTMQVTTGIRETAQQYGFRVFPQPANDYVMIAGNSNMPAGAYRLTLYTSAGQIALQKNIMMDSAGTYRFQLTGINSGIYLLKMDGHGLSLSTTLSIVH